MNPEDLRRSLRAMPPAQRRVLAALAAMVAVVTVIVVVIAAGGDDESPAIAASSTSTSPTSSTAAPMTTTEATTTTTSAPTTTTEATTTTTTLPPEVGLILRPDGLGDAFFGTDADTALGILVEVLSDPAEDTGWVNQAETFGTCLGSEVRFLRWGSLQVFLTDGPTDWAPAGVRHFAAYTHSVELGEPVLALETADGVGIGTPVGDVRAVYGANAILGQDPLFGSLFQVDVPGAGFLWGTMTGTEATDTVTSISGGFSCGE